MLFAESSRLVTGNSKSAASTRVTRRAGGTARRAAVVLGALLLAKTLVAVSADLGQRPGPSVLAVAVLFHQDALCWLAYAFFDAAVARSSRRAGAALWILCAGLVLYTAANVAVARVLSTPLTRAMFDAAGGALSDSVFLYATGKNLGAVAAVLVFATLVAATVRGPSRPACLGLAGAALSLWVVGRASTARVELGGIERNAVLTLATTSFARARGSAPGSEAPVALPPDAGAAADLTAFAASARGRDVVWVILESTAAQYLGLYGAAPDPTPNLTRLGHDALVFDAAYSAYPESIKGLMSMLCSLHPEPYTTAEDYTAERAPCRSVAHALKSAGYRTAFFHSGRFRYLGMQGILDGRGFDELHDAETVGGTARTSFGTDDASTVHKLLEFVDTLPNGQRFFAVYSPISGHHPYRAPGRRSGERPEKTDRDAYFNDLHFGDQALGELLDGFSRRGRLEKTLFVVVGDHGEAFAQHPGNFAHTLFLYEENVRVPFLVAAPGAMRGQRRAPQVASLLDMTPTTLSLLGLPRDGHHEGHSALEGEPKAAHFLSDQGPLKVGLRSGPFKCIVETEHDRTRLFDVTKDPGETRDLSAVLPARAESCRTYLLGWAGRKRLGPFARN